ncbi:hypothetical protein pb186bvf_006841 [Paramecium bursaria]
MDNQYNISRTILQLISCLSLCQLRVLSYFIDKISSTLAHKFESDSLTKLCVTMHINSILNTFQICEIDLPYQAQNVLIFFKQKSFNKFYDFIQFFEELNTLSLFAKIYKDFVPNYLEDQGELINILPMASINVPFQCPYVKWRLNNWRRVYAEYKQNLYKNWMENKLKQDFNQLDRFIIKQMDHLYRNDMILQKQRTEIRDQQNELYMELHNQIKEKKRRNEK